MVVVSISGNQQMLLWVECVISSVLYCHTKDLRQWTSVTAQLYFRVLFSNQGIVHPQGVSVVDPKGEASIYLAASFYMFCLLPLRLPYANWTCQEGEGVCFTWILTPFLRFSFVPFSWTFPFLCLLVTLILDSIFLFYLPLKEDFLIFLDGWHFLKIICIFLYWII